MAKRLPPGAVLEMELQSLKRDKEILEEDLQDVIKLIDKYEKIVKILKEE